MEKDLTQLPVIVIVDDEQEILSAIKSLLRKISANQVYFKSSAEALDFIKENPVDIIITDMKMPEVSGKELLIEAKKWQPDAIKIMLSAHENKNEILETLAKGLASYYLFKPWDDYEFIKLVEKYTNYYETNESKELVRYISSFSGFVMTGNGDQKLISLMEEQNVNVNYLCAEIENNPFLATRLIQVSNSVSFGSQRSITSIRDAVLFIGLKHLKILIISLSVLRKFTDIIHPVYHGSLNEYWERTNKRAKLARQFSLAWPVEVDTDLLFISTILSDIGELFLLYTQAEKYKQFIEFLQTTDMPRTEAEHKFFIYSHVDISRLLLNIWNFPPEIIKVVENHHNPEYDNDIVKIIQMCDLADEQGIAVTKSFNAEEFIKNNTRILI